MRTSTTHIGPKAVPMTPELWESKFGDWYVPEPNTGCWLWVRALDKRGYGELTYSAKVHRAHRVSYEMLRGQIPKPLVIDHLCNTRSCVNPAHMDIVTAAENTRRAAIKTHCKRGHALIEGNLYFKRSGDRHCKQCRTDRYHERGDELLEKIRRYRYVNRDHFKAYQRGYRKAKRANTVDK